MSPRVDVFTSDTAGTGTHGEQPKCGLEGLGIKLIRSKFNDALDIGEEERFFFKGCLGHVYF
jgi:hypothetical protein